MKVRFLRASRPGLLALLPCSAACQKSAAVAPALPPAVAQPVPGSLGDTADVAGTNGQPG